MSTTNQFATITTEGGLLPSDLISRLVSDTASLPGTRDEDYHLTPGKRLRETINRSWNDLLGAWQIFQPQVARLAPDDHTSKLTWDRWLLPLFAELGYGRLQRVPEPIVIDGKEYPVSHSHDHALVHLLGWNVSISTRTAGVVGAAKASPHSMVQELLNRSDEHLWAIVSNGRQLRVLRDNSSLTRAAYVEFDLEQMFTDGVFSDFVALWLLVHASRVEGDPQDKCWLENWATEARQQGVRALDTLGEGFMDAIEALGQGFLSHPANATLRTRLRAGHLDQQDYYRQLLRIVYRLVFLLVAEDRDLLFPEDAPGGAKDRYSRFYSLSRLRDLARRRRGTKHSDLWEQFVIVTASLGPDGQPALGLPALNSPLWSMDATADLNDARIVNTLFLSAIRSLAYTRQDQALHRIDYRNLGSEELGSVYESLLELKPDLDPSEAKFALRQAIGNERKTTGSYYTPTSLISTLLDVSLNRLLEEAEAKPDPEQALLDLKVIDPACGSGHFLVAAAQRIARRLAAIRTRESDPTPEAAQHALREVIAHCIFGIDLNPMAVELCKVSLWLEAMEPGRPLSFLDHHIVHGNGLIGATPRLLDEGVPDGAFAAIEGDDKATASIRKKINSRERASRNQEIFAFTWDPVSLSAPLASGMEEIEAVPGDTTAEVAQMTARYLKLQSSVEARRAVFAADAWCAAVFAIKTGEHPPITDATVRMAAGTSESLPPEVLDEIETLADQYQFLHWHLAFPQVYTVDLENGGETGCTGGFDLVLGNPPWNELRPGREFFARYRPDIRSFSKSEQAEVVEDLLREGVVRTEWEKHCREVAALANFRAGSGRYEIAHSNIGGGATNVYRMFVETALRMTRLDGFTAQIVPGGIYGGAKEALLRKFLLDGCRLITIIGCENVGQSFFASVHPQTWFAIYSARPGHRTEVFDTVFGVSDPQSLPPDPSQVLQVEANLIRGQNPDTYAIPDLRNALELTVAAKMTQAYPPFGMTESGPPVRHYQRELDMSNDADLFASDPAGLPLYEGRMVDQFDHRAKSYVSGHGNTAKWVEHPFGDSDKGIVPQWRVLRSDIPSKLGDRCERYRLGFVDVANPKNERSFVAALIPPAVICGDTVPTIDFEVGFEWAYLSWLAVANSFVMDWYTRCRLATTHLKPYMLDRFPFPRFPVDHPLAQRVAPLVLRLTCTSAEMTDYWNAMSVHGWCEPISSEAIPPALIDPKERDEVRAELDAIVAKHIYGLSADELAYVLDQFPVLEKRDRKAYGSYVTKERILARFDSV